MPYGSFPQNMASYNLTQPPIRIPLLIILNTDFSLGPLASRDVTPEQDVDLSERPVLHLRNEEP